MPAQTVEAKFKRAMENVKISVLLIEQGGDTAPVEQRIDWMIELLQDARRYHLASVKKQQRAAAVTCHVLPVGAAEPVCGACGFRHSEHDEYGARDGCPGWSSEL